MLTLFLAVCVTPSVIGDTLPVIVNTWPFVDANEAGKKQRTCRYQHTYRSKWVWPFQHWAMGAGLVMVHTNVMNVYISLCSCYCSERWWQLLGCTRERVFTV